MTGSKSYAQPESVSGLGQPITSAVSRDLHVVGTFLGCSPVGVIMLVPVSQGAKQIQTAAAYMS